VIAAAELVLGCFPHPSSARCRTACCFVVVRGNPRTGLKRGALSWRDISMQTIPIGKTVFMFASAWAAFARRMPPRTMAPHGDFLIAMIWNGDPFVTVAANIHQGRKHDAL
jgi:hypothetical protein